MKKRLNIYDDTRSTPIDVGWKYRYWIVGVSYDGYQSPFGEGVGKGFDDGFVLPDVTNLSATKDASGSVALAWDFIVPDANLTKEIEALSPFFYVFGAQGATPETTNVETALNFEDIALLTENNYSDVDLATKNKGKKHLYRVVPCFDNGGKAVIGRPSLAVDGYIRTDTALLFLPTTRCFLR